jgi:hypothetical protein
VARLRARDPLDPAAPEVWWNTTTRLRVALPPGVGSAVPVRVITRTGLVSAPATIAYDAPALTSLSPAVLLPGLPALNVTVCGSNLARAARDVSRLVVGPAAPDFQLVATCKALVEMAAQRDYPATPLLRRGGTQPLVVQCYRRGGFTGPVTLSCAGLPPGVTAAPVDLAADEHQATIVLAAAADAPAWQGPIRVVGRSGTGEAAIEREALACTTVWNKNNRTDFVEARLLPDLRLAVIEEQPPVLVRVGGEGPWQAAPGATLPIPVVCAWSWNASDMAESSSVPVAPYSSAKPKSMVAVLIAPRKKYLIAASMLRSAPRPIATST